MCSGSQHRLAVVCPVRTRPADPSNVLASLDRELRGLYSPRYRGLILYGSHARSEADEGHDLDGRHSPLNCAGRRSAKAASPS